MFTESIPCRRHRYLLGVGHRQGNSPLARQKTAAGQVYAAAISPDGTKLLTGGEDFLVHLWDASTGKELKQLTGHTEVVTGVAFSPDGRRLLTGSFGAVGSLRWWDVASGKPLLTIGDIPGGVHGLAISPPSVFSSGGQRALTAGGGGLFLWDLSTGAPITALRNIDLADVVFLPNDSMALSAGSDLRLWQLSH